MTYRVGSLFAGVGGVCQAFKNSNCNVVWANEIDKDACKTYRLNHVSTNLIEGDVKKLNGKNLSDIDILTAGFPCQPFSLAGHGRGFEDERGKLFFEVSRLLKELRPKAFFLENVKTIASHNNGETFKTIRNEIKRAGYSFIPFILNAAKYTDIPQGRERIYIVGFKDEDDYLFEKPIKENIKETEQSNLLSSKFKIPKETNKKPKSIKFFLDNSCVTLTDIYNDKNNKIHRKVIESVVDENIVYQYRRYYVRPNKSNVCPTLTANMGAGGHNIPIILDDGVIRRLTPKECFNLQGVSRDFILPSNISRAQLYKQAGNSVVVPMVEKIAKEIVAVLDGSDRN